MILHNMIIRMEQIGYFRDKAEGRDFVKEFYEVENATAEESQRESQEDVSTMTSKAMDDAENEAERMMVSKVEYTDHFKFLVSVGT